jgi:hypothetical protein
MAQIKRSFKELFVYIMKRIGLIISSILILVLMGAGIGLAIILRAAGLEYSGIVVPSLIVEVVGCFIAYVFATAFFPKASRDYEGGPSKKSSRSYSEPEEVEAPTSGKSDLPERNVKS